MRFRCFNIPVYIHPTFWLFLLLFVSSLLTQGGIGSLFDCLILGGVAFFSLLFHECGHALTARYFGASPTITLEAFGGKAMYEDKRMTAKQHFFVVLNGPLFSALLILGSYLALLKLGSSSRSLVIALSGMFVLNKFWLLFNLLPVFPLDGGQLFHYLAQRWFGPKGTRLALIVGVGVAALGALYYFLRHGSFVFASFLIFYGLQNFRMLKDSGRFASQQFKEETPFAAYLKGVEAIKNADTEQAKKILIKLLKVSDAQIQHAAVESLAELYFNEGEKEKSYHLLLQAETEQLKKGKALLCKLAFERRNYALVAEHAQATYGVDPSYETALLNSQACAHLGKSELAGAWLKTASAFPDTSQAQLQEALASAAYDQVRELEAFQRHAGEVALKAGKSSDDNP